MVAAVLAAMGGPTVAHGQTPPKASTRVDATGGILSSVACPTAAQCTAVDQRGDEVTFDPQAAENVTRSTVDAGIQPYLAQGDDGVGLASVACPVDTQCTAVDLVGNEVTFNPQGPDAPISAAIDSSGGNGMYAVACPAVSQCTAVDGVGDEVTFNPQAPGAPTPTSIDTSGSVLSGVACPSASQCTAVDQAGGQVTFDPQAPGLPVRTTIDLPDAGETGVTCPTETQCTVVDGDNAEVTFDPTAPGTPSPTTIADTGTFIVGLSGVACPSIAQCTAIDNYGGEVTFSPHAPPAHPTTPTWTSPHPSEASALNSIACPTVAQCTAVGGGEEVTLDPRSLGYGPPAGHPLTPALGKLVSPAGKRARIAAFLRSDGYSFSILSPSPGTFAILWRTRVHGALEQIARGVAATVKAATLRIKVRLTATGKKLLRASKSLRITSRVVFTPTAGKLQVRTGSFLVKR